MSEPTVTRAPEPDGPTVTSAGSIPGTANGAPTAPPGYELRSLIGSGGMGVVYRAHDLALARDVALKFLHARYAPDSVSAWRFTEEARITARLQHPGIPPIHQVGHTPDGRPFLAMKLIKGETLDGLLKARLTTATNRGRFVGIFEQIAQAVAFAHSRRIIHRDLKPANVMVGGFGEVQVMDWGLAKELGEAPSAEARQTEETLSVELRNGRDSADATQAGSLLGTPAYMPPEQAIGAIEQIDERADVFGLGAILCVILTNQPPFVADSAESTRIIAARGKLDDAFSRLDSCGAEPELVALCKRCLAPEAADRPKDAAEVASAVAAFRADAERRARQAEMDRATAEIKAEEERKRRRIQRVLALALVGLLAVIGYTVRRIDNEEARRRNDEETRQLREKAEAADRETERQARQVAFERNLSGALTEVRLLVFEGQGQSEDPILWLATLGRAKLAFQRAEKLIEADKMTPALHAQLETMRREISDDERDCRLLADLDRVADENEIRMLIPVAFTDATSRKFAAAFRTAGIDLTEATHEEITAWLKTHRFRDRLSLAIRTWTNVLPPAEMDNGVVIIDPPYLNPLAGLVGEMGVTTLRHKPNLGVRLNEALSKVTTDPFTREWWEAVKRSDNPALKKLVTRPELQQMSSREMASLADGLAFGNEPQVVQTFMALAYDRFPGAFWVHFRYAMVVEISKGTDDPNNAGNSRESLRHLTAAVAARPRSAIARAALGMQLTELGQDDAGMRMLKSAAEVDPTSPWPHMFLGMHALEKEKWEEAGPPLLNAVRTDPDTGYFMIHTVVVMLTYKPVPGTTDPDPYFTRLIEKAAVIHPNHPGSHDLLGELHLKKGNARAALAAFRKANELASANYLRKPMLTIQIAELERKAQWEGKIDDVLKGKLKPDSIEMIDLAGYCALFEKKYALATNFADAALKADKKLIEQWSQVANFAGWAIRASSGAGADGANLTAQERTVYRQKALAWLRESLPHVPEAQRPYLASVLVQQPELLPVVDPHELAKLPADERVDWEKFWSSLPPASPLVPRRKPEIAPPPREIKR